ncbi:CHAT domain-containing protein [Brasilonema sp. CT11]|nr:CHAT domain-containing protein [Brasilonema sp. CT11]
MVSKQFSDGNNAFVKTILVLAANPKSTSRLRLDEEVREIDEGLRRSSRREQFCLEQKWAVRQRDFYRAILDYQPQIIHFSGHGMEVDGIVLEDETEQPVEVNALALASMFKLFATKGVECVLLNACYSEVQAKAIGQHVKYVIGMNKTVGDKAAIAFSVAFYDALAAGEQMEFAYELGCSVLINYLEQQTPVLFKKDETNIISVQQKEDISVQQKEDISVQQKEDIIPPNPYQGLAAFGEEDAAFFFGRETFVNGLVEAVNKQPLVAVIGPSGTGKSSVVYAGLIPQLRMTGNWLIESFRPGNKPFYQLASALVRQLVPEIDEIQQLRSAAGLEKNIQQGSVTLDLITSRIKERNPGKRLLLFVDQFEELYTLCQKEEQERFADLMLQAIQHKSLTLVFTLRADFYGFVLAYRPLRDALQQFTPQLLSAMNPEELHRAIEQPALKIEVQLETQLTQRILEDVGNEPGNLPLLEFALTRLWNKQQKRRLTHQAYDEIGGVKKALANHAEQIYQQLNEQEQKQARRIFVQLVRPGEGTEDTRRIATRYEVGDENWGLVSDLAGHKARLVVTGRDENLKEDTVEVVHEALIREWPTLREWMKKDRLFRAWQERLRVIIREWEETKRDLGVLLRGVPLGEAEEKLKERREELSPSEQNFIQLSIELRDRDRQLEEERRQQELEAARKIAQESEARRKAEEELRKQAVQTAEQETRARRAIQTRNRLTIGLLLAFTILAGYQWREAEIQGIQAQVNSSELSFNSNNELEALKTSLIAGEKLKHSWWQAIFPDSLKSQTMTALDQTVYWLGERNKWSAHTNTIRNIQFSPDRDRQIIASASADNTIKLWDLKGNLLNTLKGHTDLVNSVSFSPDGKMLASASWDGTVKLWSINGDLLDDKRNAHKAKVYSVSFSPDGKMLASASWDGTVKLWNVNGSKLSLFKKIQPRPEILKTTNKDNNHNSNSLKQFDQVSFSPDGQLIAAGSDDGKVWIWDRNGKLLTILSGHHKRVYAVSFSPDRKFLASSSGDNTILLWDAQKLNQIRTLGPHESDAQKLKPIKTLDRHESDVFSIAFSADGKTLISASQDNTIKFWRVEDGKVLKTLVYNNPVRSVSINQDGLLALGGLDFDIKLWRTDGNDVISLTGHSQVLNNISLSHNSKTVATGGNDQQIKLWNKLNGKELRTLVGHESNIITTSFSPDDSILASGDSDGKIILWNPVNGTKYKVLKAHDKRVGNISFSPDGMILASVSDDKTIKLWNQKGNLIAPPFPEQKNEVKSISFSPDGKMIASGSVDTITLWNVELRQPIQILRGHTGAVNSVSFSSDGKMLASGSEDKTIKIWSIPDGKELKTLQGHTAGINSVSFRPNSKMLASGSDDKTIKIWNAKTGEEITTLKGHAAQVYSVSFSPDGNTLGSASGDSTALLWKTELFDLDKALVKGNDLIRDCKVTTSCSQPQ